MILGEEPLRSRLITLLNSFMKITLVKSSHAMVRDRVQPRKVACTNRLECSHWGRQTRSRFTPHSMQNLAVSTGNLLPHSWQKRERRGAGCDPRSDASEPLELMPPLAPLRCQPGLRRDDARDEVRFSETEVFTYHS